MVENGGGQDGEARANVNIISVSHARPHERHAHKQASTVVACLHFPSE